MGKQVFQGGDSHFKHNLAGTMTIAVITCSKALQSQEEHHLKSQVAVMVGDLWSRVFLRAGPSPGFLLPGLEDPCVSVALWSRLVAMVLNLGSQSVHV